MTKHVDYFEMVDAIKGGSVCPICYLVDRTVENYIDSFLYEGVNDIGLRKDIKDSNGFCNYHAWKLMAHGDPLAHAIIYSDLIETALAKDISVKPEAKSMCPYCKHEQEAEKRYLSILKDAIADGEFRDLYANSAGLCMNHFYLLLKMLDKRSRDKEFAINVQRKGLESLLKDLKEIMRKSDYRFADEPWENERDAWIKAVYKWVGKR